MPEFFAPWIDVGAGGLVVLFVLSIYFNLLIPKKTVDNILRIQKSLTDLQEQRINDRDEIIAELRKTNEALDKRNDLLADQVRQLIEVGKTTNAAINALPLPERNVQ